MQRDGNGVPLGKVILHFNGDTNIDGGKTCVNIDKDGCNGSPQGKDEMARQYPDKLQIVVHNGTFKTQGNVHIAAGILVSKGDADFASGTPTTIIGEVLAKNIKTQNNSANVFYYKSVASIEQLITTGFSTIAPPAVPPVIEVDSITGRDLEYLASQSLDPTTKNVSGHLTAYKVQKTGLMVDKASWDAATEMSVTDRANRLYTNVEAETTFTRINASTVPSTPLRESDPDNSRYNKAIVIDPNDYNGAYLAGRAANSLVGRPWRTAPVIARSKDDRVNLVLFAADDGILYAVDGTTGALKWGWVPKDILPLTAKPKDLMDMHPWGQLGFIQLGEGDSAAYYVTGTALSGALHFSIKLNKETGLLDSIVWYDYSLGGQSPTVGKDVPLIGSSKDVAANLVGAAPGGQAPTPAMTQNADTKGLVAYIRDNKLFIRRVDSNSVPVVNGQPVDETVGSQSATPTTNLIFVDKDKLAFGDSLGQVKLFSSSIAAPPSNATFRSKVSVSANNQLLGITATTDELPKDVLMTLLVYDKENVNSVNWKTDGSLVKGWHIGKNGSDTGLPKLPSSFVLSAVPTVSKGQVYIPFTVPPDDGVTTCLPVGYAMGPLKVNTGEKNTTTKTKFNDTAISDANFISKFGNGEMQRLEHTILKTGKLKEDAVLGISDYGRLDKDSKKNDGAYKSPIGVTLKRILWREISNF